MERVIRKTKNFATLLVFVQDYKLTPLAEAVVQVHSVDSKTWQKVPYDANVHRFVLKGLVPGKYEVRIRGEKEWAVDVRDVTLHTGNNFIYSTLAPAGMPYYRGAEGEKVYFQPEESRILLHAQGKNVHEVLPRLVNKAGLKLGDPILLPRQKLQQDNATFMINLPEAADERRKALANLHVIVAEQFPRSGLTGRLAATIVRGESVIEGLTNQMVVKFESNVTEQKVQEIAKRYKCTIVRRINYLGNAYLFEYGNIPTYDILKIAQDLMDKFPVLYAEPNILIQIEQDVYNPNDYLYPEQQHFQVIHADDAWDTLDDIDADLRMGSPDITIAVFDGEGVSPNHPDLTGNLTDGTAKMIANFDFVSWSNQTVANLAGDHGTQCCSSAAGRSDNTTGVTGLAGNCHLIGARRGGSATVVDIVDGWIWAAGFPTGSTNPNFPPQLATGADIISNSWGGGFAWSDILKDGLDFLTVYGRGGKGCVVCFSVGNLGYESFSAERRMASYERTIAVGATINANPTNPCNSIQADPAGNFNNLPAVVDTRTYYNPYGPEMDIVAPSHTCYDAALPGARVRDAVMAAVRVDEGDWPGDSVAQTMLTSAAAAGNAVVQVANSAGFNVGEFALFGGPGATPNETKEITAVAAGQITVLPLENAYPVGTIVVTGPNNYAMNPSVGFGGTSHSCPTVAGAGALILSVRPELTWVQVREILRTTTTRIDVGQADPIGRWVDNDGDGINEFSQWYGFGRLDVNTAVIAARDLGAVPDVVVRDNLTDDGTVPSAGWHAESPDIWVRRTDDPIPSLAYDTAPPHEDPFRNQDNYVYMRVKNFGGVATNEVYLRALITHFPGFEFRYPEDWQPSTRPGDPAPVPLERGTYLIGEERIDNLAPNEDIIVKMTWDADLVPPDEVIVGGVSVKWHPCLLAEVSPHDGPAPAGDTFDVKRDNNLAQRNITVWDPEDTSDDLAIAVAAGTTDAVGVDSVIIDRSLVPADFKVFIRIADERHMRNWVKLVKAGAIETSEPLQGSPYVPQEPALEGPDLPNKRRGCTVLLLDSARIGIDCCDGNALVIKAPSRTRIEMLCRGRTGRRGHPKVTLGMYKDREVIFFEGDSDALELPLRLAAGEFIPVIVGLVRPHGKQVRGILKATQRRGDGELSPGYSLEG